MTIKTKSKTSIFGGACIIACVCVGAGMLGLPSAGAGSWLLYSTLIIGITMLMMTLSGWLLLMVYQHYDYDASFNTVTQDLLGPVFSIINNLAVYFVGAILLYAYTTQMGLILAEPFGLHHNLMAVLAVLVLSAIVWWSTKAVDRFSVLMLLLMALTFVFSVSGLTLNIQWDVLLDSNTEQHAYAKYAWIMFPVALTSFGYHHTVTSLRAYYQDENRAKYAIMGGTFIALVLYTIWLVCIFGNLPRADFGPVLDSDGQIDVLVKAVAGPSQSASIKSMLDAFSLAAIVSSFVGVGLGVFDFIADFFKINKDRRGRSILWGLTFLLPLVLSIVAPFGFVPAIAYAGAAAAIWTCIVPALLAYKSLQKHGSTAKFAVRGTSFLIPVLFIFGLGVTVIHLLNEWNFFPVFHP